MELSLSQQIEALRAENEALKAKVQVKRNLTLKVSARGALSVYGLGRFPVTLYRGQWERLLAVTEDLNNFIKANEATLTVKEGA